MSIHRDWFSEETTNEISTIIITIPENILDRAISLIEEYDTINGHLNPWWCNFQVHNIYLFLTRPLHVKCYSSTSYTKYSEFMYLLEGWAWTFSSLSNLEKGNIVLRSILQR